MEFVVWCGAGEGKGLTFVGYLPGHLEEQKVLHGQLVLLPGRQHPAQGGHGQRARQRHLSRVWGAKKKSLLRRRSSQSRAQRGRCSLQDQINSSRGGRGGVQLTQMWRWKVCCVISSVWLWNSDGDLLQCSLKHLQMIEKEADDQDLLWNKDCSFPLTFKGLHYEIKLCWACECIKMLISHNTQPKNNVLILSLWGPIQKPDQAAQPPLTKVTCHAEEFSFIQMRFSLRL